MAGSILAESPLPRKDVVLISAFQRTGWAAGGLQFAQGDTLGFEVVGYGNPTTFGAMIGGRPSVATITVANPAAGSDWVYTATAEFIHSIQKNTLFITSRV